MNTFSTYNYYNNDPEIQEIEDLIKEENEDEYNDIEYQRYICMCREKGRKR